jgi:hypothetical protein
MATVTEQLQDIRNQVSGLRTRLFSLTPNDILYSYIGESVLFGCRVTEGDDGTDMEIALEGDTDSAGDVINPDVEDPPLRGFQYPNIASLKDGAFRSTSLVATVETAPATGLGRYDIAYIFVGQAGAGFAIATGTPGSDVKADYDGNGLDLSPYGEAAIADPELPVGAAPVGRIYVEDDVPGIPQNRIADLRVYSEAGQAALSEYWAEQSSLSAAAAAGSASNASTSEGNASDSESNAAASALAAEQWAITPEDVPVPASGSAMDFSSLHWAAKSAASAASALTSENNAETAETNAETAAATASNAATTATTQANTAATHAATAATQAGNAAASAATAASLVAVALDEVPPWSNPKAHAQAIHMKQLTGGGAAGIKVASTPNANLSLSGFSCFTTVALDFIESSFRLMRTIDGSDYGWQWSALADKSMYFTTANGGSGTNVGPRVATVAANEMAMFGWVFSGPSLAAGNMQFYQNGIALGASFSTASMVYGEGSGDFLVLGGPSTRHGGKAQSVVLYNRALSGAEVLDLALNGVAFADKWGSSSPVYSSDFSAGADSWVANGGSNVAGNIDGIAGVDDCLRLYAVSTSGQNAKRTSGSPPLGKNTRVTFDYYLPSTNTHVNGVKLLEVDAGWLTTSQVITDTWTSVSVPIYKAAANGYQIYLTEDDSVFLSGAAGIPTDDVVYIKNFKVWQVGATLALEPEGIQPEPGQWHDASSNKLHAMQPDSGSSIVRPQKTFEVRWTNTWAGTHELQYIGGVNQAILPTNACIDEIEGRITGATIEDIIIGDGSDTDRFVALTTGLAAGTTFFTLANRLTDGTNFKLTVDPDANFTGSIAFTIRGHISE